MVNLFGLTCVITAHEHKAPPKSTDKDAATDPPRLHPALANSTIVTGLIQLLSVFKLGHAVPKRLGDMPMPTS